MISVCKKCGDEFETYPSAKAIYCSMKCYDKSGKNNPRWNGGKFSLHGYVMVYRPNHPFATKAGYVCEHRLVMEKIIGRYLERGEAVHHLNHDRTDNKPENLHLCESNGKHFIDHHLKERDGGGRFKIAVKSNNHK